MNRMLKLLSAIAILLWCFAGHANAAPRVIIAPQSDTVYVIQGMDFSNVSGLDLTIHYDPAALGSPRFAQGSLVGGALMAANVSSPGTARLALVRVVAFNGSGPIATVTFSRIRSTGAEIQSLTASALSASGSKIQVGTDITNSPIATSTGTPASGQDTGGTTAMSENQGGSAGSDSAASAGAASQTAVGATASPNPAAPGILAIPASALPEKTEAVLPSSEKAASATDQPGAEKTASQESQVALAEKPAVKAPEPEKKVLAYQSVLDKFQDYKGNKSPQSFIALFSANPGKQDPPLVLSDGKTTVRIVLELDSKGENNHFLLDGVTLVSLRNKEGNLWIAELLPDRKTLRASVSVPNGHQLNVMPLNVAPPLDASVGPSTGKLTETDFQRYLKERGTAKSPRFDLNGDGVRNYIDDYIFTANYLAQPKERKVPDKGK